MTGAASVASFLVVRDYEKNSVVYSDFIAQIAAAVISLMVTVSIGSTELTLNEVYTVLSDHLFYADEKLNAGEFPITHFKIIWQISPAAPFSHPYFYPSSVNSP